MIIRRLKLLLTLAANALALGAGLGIVSGLWESHRQGYLRYGSTTLAIRTIANETVVGMVAAGVVALLAATCIWTIRPSLHARRRWAAVLSVLLLAALIFVIRAPSFPPE